MQVSTFAIDVQAWCVKTEVWMTDKLRKAVIELCTRIIDDNPVEFPPEDKVVSKGDWNASVGSEPGDVDRNDSTGNAAKAAVLAAVLAWNPAYGDTFYFANYKPYIMRIEFLGWGTTPPYGMFGRHVIEWADIVKEAGL